MFGGYGMGGGMGWGWLFLVILVVGVVVLVVLLVMVVVRGASGGRAEPRSTGPSRAREILDERYARGEIDTAEYQDRLQQLGERR
ncbi:SHOCT domain-containing protein [Tessaracoccus antarcticus]|uniref:SHOCT domain-containing protein n=1 Tax=Tessaracoccus antarcticus TaxID=2479848 RepID=A0A3M0FX80_9ACTN|nr:SHOCT domain-containing protein [Tessaracoccus antarcticus]RMB57078.1 SHOCT domain-containing protein [Tessaracoccus antarcticus]